MITKIGHYGPRYVFPLYEKSKTTLLNEVKENFK
jgi:hypothetical protein